MRRYSKVLFFLFFICCEGVLKGQSEDAYILSLVDSLDQVRSMKQQCVKPIGKAYTIRITTQAEFDKLNNCISDAINAGKTNIRIKIGNGTFRYRENHILRMDEQYPEVSIIFEGRKRTMLTSHRCIVKLGTTIPEAWQAMKYADGLIEVVDEGKKLCRIPFDNNMTLEERRRMSKVQVTEWFRAPVYEVEMVDGSGVYFVATDLQVASINGRTGYNVNYDFLYRQKVPRFRLYDGSKECKCNAARMFCIERCNYRSISLEGLHFMGKKVGGPLITFGNIQANSVSVTDCSFAYISGHLMEVSATNNVSFCYNTVQNTEGDELRFLSNCQNVRVTNNLFENCGKSISNSFCVNCREASYYIAHNIFRDFGYGAIGVGVWHGFEKKHYSGGIIEHNEICFTPVYFANAWKYMLMDSGALYSWTQNDDVIIRYNYIHDYTGAADNRGIFCDDGANNMKIYNNVVINTPNCYSIDARMSKEQKEGFTNNANNFMANNVVDNGVRFQGHSDVQRHVVKGSNIVVKNKAENVIKDSYENLEYMEEDRVKADVNSKTIRKQIKKCMHQ